MEKIIHFVRHGESLANTGMSSPDHATIPLTPKGHEQARLVSEFFTLEPELIVHTKYSRTLETARPLIERFPKAKVEVWPLHEFTYLDTKKHAGTTPEQRQKSREHYWSKLNPDYADGFNSESFAEMLTRIRHCLQGIKESQSSKIVIYCHGEIMHALGIVFCLPDASDEEIMRTFREDKQDWYAPKNTEVWETRINEDGEWLPIKTIFTPEE